MSTVLWGKRRGDVQYNSRDYWRRNIPIDPSVNLCQGPITLADLRTTV